MGFAQRRAAGWLGLRWHRIVSALKDWFPSDSEVVPADREPNEEPEAGTVMLSLIPETFPFFHLQMCNPDPMLMQTRFLPSSKLSDGRCLEPSKMHVTRK